MSTIFLKTKSDLEKLRYAGSISAQTLDYLFPLIQPGIATSELDKLAKSFMQSKNCTSTFLGYKDYPFSTCLSVNEEVVHNYPSNRILKEGDILKVDLGASYEGWCGDTAFTICVGNVSPDVKKFVDIGYETLLQGLQQVKEGNHILDISKAIHSYTQKMGVGVVAELSGHGIGKGLHEPPQIPNILFKGDGPELVEGMVICLEPILTVDKNPKIRFKDKWQIVTDSLSCHWEHTVIVTKDGPEVITLREGEIAKWHCN